MAEVRSRLQRISRLPGLSAFRRAFAANSYVLSSLLYAAQYTGVVPAQQAAELTVWTSALVDAGLGPDGDVVRGLRRPPGIPANCMMAHPRYGGFGLLPVQQHLFSRWACEAVQLLLGDAAKRWIAAGRAVLRHCADAGPAIAGSVWDLALCGREWLFPGQNAAALLFSLPEPLRAMALGLRALPPLEYVGPEQALAPGPWCYNAPLFDNPLTAARQQWDWFGQQREVAVGLDYVLPSLVGLPKLRSVGQAVPTLRLVENIAGISDPGMRQEAYRLQVWQPVLAGRPYYSFIGHAVADLGRLVGALPPPWVAAARAVEQACYSAGQLLPVVTDAGLAAAWARMAPHLGWRLPYGGGVVRLAALTVKLATRLQARNVQAAIDARHDAFITSVRALDAGQDGGALPQATVRGALARWWRLKVPNMYKEAAWRRSLDAFPTARRMGEQDAVCVACGAQCPDVRHHFWLCSVAEAVRREVEAQLVAFQLLPQGTRLRCAALWLGVRPHAHVLPWVWDLVCIAVAHAMEVGRSAAWAVSREVSAHVPAVVDSVAKRAAVAAFWSALADFAATSPIPRSARVLPALAQQPFIAWHVVVVQGSGLRVVRR
jgi:hypothetical protein